MLSLLFAFVIFFAGGVFSDPCEPPREDCPTDARVVQAAPLRGEVVIDGRLDEAVWATTPASTGFRQLEPNEGAPASQQTVVRVLYGESNLYIGARLYDEHPDEIIAALGRRDEYHRADWFTVSTDSYFNQKPAYTFAVNAAGVQLDGLRAGRLDTSWDALWTAAARVTDEGWVAEMRIPYAMLRFTEEEVQTWGIQFRRRIPRLSEVDEWKLIPRTERSAGVVAQYGLLTGLRDLEPHRNVQIRPYTLSRLETTEGAPGELAAAGDFRVGGDLKVGLSSNITLDATINPDFGQVESDPAVLNLSAFATFFPEKRPFFLEGTEIFEFSLGRGRDLLYTRRIGGRAPIVGAAKISGRTGSGLAFGVLGATTGEGFIPRRHYGVTRLTQQIGAYSSAGGILTLFNAPSGGDARRIGLAGGADWDLRFAGNTYGLEGYASVTHRTRPAQPDETGLAASLEFGRLQGALTYDLGLTLLDDTFNPNDVGRLRRNNFFRISGGADYDVNGGDPFGPFQRASFGLFGGQSWSYRERLNQGLGFFFFSNWTTRGFQNIGLNIGSDYLFGGYDLYETRGLGPRTQPRQFSLSLEFETDDRRSWQIEPEVEAEFASDGGAEYGLSLEARWSAGTRLTLSGSVEYGREDDAVAWASNETFALNDAGAWMIGAESAPPAALEADDYTPFDDGGRLRPILASVTPYGTDCAFTTCYYVPIFGARDTRSLDFSLRGRLAFTPDLSLQLYTQLFVARGRYDRFQLLQSPDAQAAFAPYPKRHPFSLSSFLSNLVLRWEFRPGSRLYLVWSQTRRQNRDAPFFSGGAPPHGPPLYDSPMAEQLAGTFGFFPTNVFLFKLTYTFLG